MLHQALGLFQDHFRHLDVALGRFVEGGAYHFGLHRALHVRHFLGPLVDQQHDENDFRVIPGDAVGDILQEHGLAGPGRGHDEPPLALADGGHEVHDAGRVVVRIRLQTQALVGIKGGQIVKEDFIPGDGGVFEIDRLHLEEGEVALPFLGGPDLPRDGVAGAQVEPPNLGGRHIDVIRPGQVVVIRRP